MLICGRGNLYLYANHPSLFVLVFWSGSPNNTNNVWNVNSNANFNNNNYNNDNNFGVRPASYDTIAFYHYGVFAEDIRNKIVPCSD